MMKNMHLARACEERKVAGKLIIWKLKLTNYDKSFIR